jgi:hypothetical protein
LQSNKEEDAGKFQHLTRMLIFVSFAYIAVSFPYRLFLVIITLDIYKFEDTSFRSLGLQSLCRFIFLYMDREFMC